jgi:hypothetical protein
VALLSLEGRQSEISDKLHKVFEFFSPLLLSGLLIWCPNVFLLVLLKILEVGMRPPEYAGVSMCESHMLVGLNTITISILGHSAFIMRIKIILSWYRYYCSVKVPIVVNFEINCNM